MSGVSENLIWVLAASGVLILGALALRLIFAPENDQERKAAERIRGTRSETERQAANAVILKQRQHSTGGRNWPLTYGATSPLPRPHENNTVSSVGPNETSILKMVSTALPNDFRKFYACQSSRSCAVK